MASGSTSWKTTVLQPSPVPPAPSLSRSPSSRCHLLALPGELRNWIYRLAVVSDHSIEVGLKGYARSGLLATSREIRAETLQIFYYENQFDILALELDPTTLARWCRMLTTLERTPLHHAAKLDTSNPCAAHPGVTTAGQGVISQRKISMNPHIRQTANWTNLMRWVHQWHVGAIPARLTYPAHLQNAEVRIVHAMFDMAMVMRGQPWSVVGAVLSVQRPVLVAMNQAWGLDP
jgi:hypothetical protein